QLVDARTAVESGDIDRAAELFQSLLDSGDDGTELVKELEAAVDKQPNSAELVKLLGDAYMQNGQLQKALSTYRKGFDHL
ncbi:MAG: tetratricopeptide repeat protein, partial [Candidatus Promineifilaceae bacterium]|nr:tetratricopeptide repeat protein [Candidatus Promineifilaceae bacterium]